ncbi:HXXEE domain-containing protein [Streptomyces sp. NPDC127084]|uniref:HXXEE domain-containing protein n=1 Tax=Streptomyces sp. NPDC127084 TaxID=3347133 RepID=UPI003658D72C
MGKPNALVTYGLLAAWAIHDAEELITGPRWIRRNVPALRERFPGAPGGLWRIMEAVDEREFPVAVGTMAVIVTAAAAAGHRSGGRSGFYQGALTGFGLHGLVHLGQAAAFRGYTPGSATSPLIVVPFSLWARKRLREAGVLKPARARDVLTGLAVAAGATIISHTVARKITGPRVKGA